MACQAGKWRYGLAAIAVLWLGVNGLETSRIEADLAARARSPLERLAIKGGAPQVLGRDVILKGESPNDNLRAAALAGVAEVTGVRKTVDALSVVAQPPVAKASTEAPTPAGQAKAGPAAPAGDAPKVEPEQAAAKSGDGQSHGAPVSSPYVFHAETSGGKVILRGLYPDAETHQKILAGVGKDFPGRELVDQMKGGAGAPRDFVEAALAGLAQLARLREGALDLRDHAARLRGEAAGADLADDIRSGFVGALPGGFAVESQLTGPARAPAPTGTGAGSSGAGAGRVEPQPPAKPEAVAAACQARMAALVREHPIQFAIGSARLLVESAVTLDALAAEAKKCPGAEFEIAGHTDDVGYVSENLELSRRRAEHVLVYLVAVGVAPERLRAVGYGERRPLVPNENDENRAKNRRIEFNLK